MMRKYTIRHGSIAWYCHKYFKPVSILLCVSTIIAILHGATFAFAEPELTTIITTPRTITYDEPEPEPTIISLGEYTISHYCRENYPHICNNGDATYTATMTTPTPGRTIAVDPTVIPYGTEVIINGHTYIAEDCGGAIKGNRIDVLCNTHAEALQNGMQTAEVFIIK